MLVRTESSTIAAVLRTRICMMQSSTEEITLHEGMIATEFGVSRTPIRQVLQKLAYERLVETRSGVGTIVSPLDPDHRDRDLVVLQQLFRAAGICSRDAPLRSDVFERLVAVQAISEIASRDAKGYLNTRTELLEIAAEAAPDTILGDAMRAAHWRHIRWRMAEHAWMEAPVFDALIDTVRACVTEARENGAAGFYDRLASQEL